MPEHYVDIDRRSPMLLPVDMRDWVARDRLAQLVIDTIEQCDLRRAVTNDRGTGSRQYPPGMMVSLLIYAYAQGVFSSRRIERLTYENLSFRYVCANTHPDHDTIAKFRRENAALFQDCMRAIIEVGQEFGMVKLGMLAVDGTRLQANANRHRFATREQLEQQQASIEELIKGLLKKLKPPIRATKARESLQSCCPSSPMSKRKWRRSRRSWSAPSNAKLSKKSKRNTWPSAVGAATPARYGLISPIQTVGSCTVKALGRWLVLTPRSRSMCKGRV